MSTTPLSIRNATPASCQSDSSAVNTKIANAVSRRNVTPASCQPNTKIANAVSRRNVTPASCQPNTKIANAVSIIYYPGQKATFLASAGHAELEVQGKCWTLGLKKQITTHNLEEKIKRANKGGLPFKQIKLWVTLRQLSLLKNILSGNTCTTSSRCLINADMDGDPLNLTPQQIQTNKKAYGLTCMHGVSVVLAKADIVHIPPFVNLSPLPSYAYCAGAKALHFTQIDKIESYGKTFGNIRNSLGVARGVAGEILTIVMVIMIIYSNVTKLIAYFT